jgi:hypothetical protein
LRSLTAAGKLESGGILPAQKEREMSDDIRESAISDPQEALRVLDDARARLRTVIWALHGMHQDLSVLTENDLSDVEHMLTEVLENALNPSFEALTEMLGGTQDGAVTQH